MEYLGEKVAYLKGLAEGLALDESTKEGKILLGVLDVLDEMASALSELEDDQFELQELADELDEDLGILEDEIYGDSDDDDDEEDDEDFYEIECPKCNDKIYIEDSEIFEDGVICPNCNEKIVIDFECECGCDDCHADD